MESFEIIFILLIAFQIKHYLADYPLQTEYMLGKFKLDGWFLPLAAHCGVHAFFTMFIALACHVPYDIVFGLGLIDFIFHFSMDRIKADPEALGKYEALTKETFPTATDEQKKSNKFFWFSLGFDQMIHHLTHYLIIYRILENIK